MPELIFEIGVEELPADSLETASQFMTDFFIASMNEHRLETKDVSVQATPRRLVLMCGSLPQKQADSEEEVLGPSTAVAYENQVLSKAGLGFVKAKGLNESQLYKKKTDKGEVIAAKVTMKGQDTATILPSVLADMMRKIPFKKRMRWDASGDSFARPVRWLVARFDNAYLDISFADVKSGSHSYGHRFLYPEPFNVTSIAQYMAELRNRAVILSSDERARLIKEEASARVSKLGGHFVEDLELMDIVKNLMEYPFVIVGSFDATYLKIPKEILMSEMKTHQKYFSVYDAHDNLMPYFICVAAVKPYDEEVFAKGNARVLRARFDDGAFYFAEDQKKTIVQHAQGLSSLVFERELGTMAQKSERILHNARALAGLFNCSNDEKAVIEEAAPLLKADLVTGVVGQFPELQGNMGGIYARLNGHSEACCEAIKTHYWPRFSEDALPPNKVCAILSIADKIDTLVGIMAIGKGPKGNKDPFALRRAAIALVRIIVGFELSCSLNELIAVAHQAYGARFSANLNQEVRDFVVQRARGVLIEDLGRDHKEFAVNFADGVLAVGSDDILDVFKRAQTLFAMRQQNSASFDSLVQTIKRASNIVKKADGHQDALTKPLSKTILHLPCEIALIEAVEAAKISCQFTSAIRYDELFTRIVDIKPKLDAFFDGVMVMVDDEQLKNARLQLLGTIKGIADTIADFTHL